MTTFSEYRPTCFDGPGNYIGDDLSNRKKWIVLPIGRNRDTADSVSISNWRTVCKMLEEEKIRHEIHNFGHWACGWYEIILVHPKHEAWVYGLENALSKYPLLDDEDHSLAGMEAEQEAWDIWGQSEFEKEIRRRIEGLMSETEGEPWDPSQRWCQHWGMDIDLCQCGDCITTDTVFYSDLLDDMDDLTSDQWKELSRDWVEWHQDGSGACMRTKLPEDDTVVIERIQDVLGQEKTDGTEPD